MAAYYNEHNPHTADWLDNLIREGLLPAGDVDDRSIEDVEPRDLRGYTQVHLFAGIGGWAYGARLAGWPDDRPLWTGSPPCQPWSKAGAGGGGNDDRHLWPEMCRLIEHCRPAVVMGEQVPTAVARGWWDEVAHDLEGLLYSVRAVLAPVCAVGAFHGRERLYFVAHAGRAGSPSTERPARGEPHGPPGLVGRPASERSGQAPWAHFRLESGSDEKPRMVEPGIRLLAHGIPQRVDVLTAIGNAVVPQIVAQVIGAWMDATG